MTNCTSGESVDNIDTYVGKMIGNFPDNWTEEMKGEARQMCEMQAQSLYYLTVVYHPNCGCDTKISFVLDRFPMSPKIICRCQICKKGCLAEISDPITFYLKLTDQEYSCEDLKNMYITDSPQKHLIEKYRDMPRVP